MLQVALHDEFSAGLAAMPERVRQALSEKAGTLAAALEAKIQQKLSGGVLSARSGALLRAIVATIDDGNNDVTAPTAASGDVKYVPIHEFGGPIPPHQIVPDKAKALAF